MRLPLWHKSELWARLESSTRVSVSHRLSVPPIRDKSELTGSVKIHNMWLWNYLPAVMTEPFLANIPPANYQEVLKRSTSLQPGGQTTGFFYLLIFRAKARRSALPREAICEPGESESGTGSPLTPPPAVSGVFPRFRCLAVTDEAPLLRSSKKPRYNSSAVMSTLIPPFRLGGSGFPGCKLPHSI